MAKLDDWLRAFLGDDGPAWSPTYQYVTVDGAEVLIVVVEPPRWGDWMFVLRKTYQPQKGASADKGMVFIRREAKTDRANDAEMDMLQERLLRGQRQPGLEGCPLLRTQSTHEHVRRISSRLDLGRHA